jgi:hypothetical protein
MRIICDTLPITAEIAVLSRSSLLQQDDPADRLIAATALHGGWPLITADEQLRALPDLWGCPNSMDRSHATFNFILAGFAWRSSKETGVQ